MTIDKEGIAELLNNHDVDLFIAKFIRYYPDRLEYACGNDWDQYAKDLANHLDYIEFHYRRYLSGLHKTLRRVNDEIRQYMENGYSEYIVFELLIDIRSELLEYEFYELITKCDASIVKTTRFVKKVWDEA